MLQNFRLLHGLLNSPIYEDIKHLFKVERTFKRVKHLAADELTRFPVFLKLH